MAEETEHKDETLEPTEAPVNASVEPEHSNGNGTATSSDGQQQQEESAGTITPASESPPLEGYRSEDYIGGAGPGESSTPSDAGEGSGEAAPVAVAPKLAKEEQAATTVKGIGMISGLPTGEEITAKIAARNAAAAAKKAETAAREARRREIEEWQKASTDSACESMSEIVRLINNRLYREYADGIEGGIEKMTAEMEAVDVPQSAKEAVLFAAIQRLLLGVARTKDACAHVTRIAEMLGVIDETVDDPTHEGVIELPREMGDGKREGFPFKSALGDFAPKIIELLTKFSDEVYQR